MKKLVLMLMVVVLTFALVAIAIGQPVNNVKNTKHNLSTSGSGSFKSTNEDEICIFCHTPHQSGTSQDPLWNHTLSSVANYGVYASNTFNGSGTIAEIAGTNNTSLLCMSCHDGTVALNSLFNPSNQWGVPAGATISSPITGTANLGTDLTNDHPVNFVYDAALVLADGTPSGLNDPTTQIVPGYAGTINQVLLSGTRVQCSSCHGPHIDYSGANSGYSPFLKVDNTGSALCLTCHIK